MVCREGWCSRESVEGSELCSVHNAIRAEVRQRVLAAAAALDYEERREARFDHGTRGSYGRGCRCPGCTLANRVYARKYRLAGPSSVPSPCGTKSAYSRGCRCEPCREANRECMRNYYRERREADGSNAALTG